MKFGGHYGIERGPEDDWFDPVLTSDTRLFIDPFAIYSDDDDRWRGAHDELIEFFNMTLELVARSDFRTSSAAWRAAERLLTFPEPAEFCLGYGDTPFGSGTGEGFGAEMLEGAKAAIREGLVHVRHFEELTLFATGIGPDRISDIVCNVLKSRFVEYTQEIAERHYVETVDLPVRHARWSRELEVWMDRQEHLPLNPWTKTGTLLVPTRFLRPLPTVTPEDFWDWSWEYRGDEIRGEFNYDIGKNVNAQVIVAFARANPQLADAYVAYLEEAGPGPPYDFENDPDSEVRWYDDGLQLAAQSAPPRRPDDPDAFCDWVKRLLNGFADNIEQQDGWILLWVGNKPRPERYVQAMLRTAVWQVCRDNDIDFTGEPNAGRGPADFKFSVGSSRRALAELKLTSNTRYWSGLERQTPQYLRSEGITCGFFISIGLFPKDFENERTERVHRVAREVSRETGYNITPILVDARPKPPASRA